MSPAFPELDPNLVARETSMQRMHTVEVAIEGIKNSLRITEMVLNPVTSSYYLEPTAPTVTFKSSEVAKQNSEFTTRARQDVDNSFRDAA